MRIESERSWPLAAPPATVWAALAEPTRYRTWWPWLTRFDGRSLAEGAVWRCRVASPLGYGLSFELHITAIDPRVAVAAELDGDLEGTAELRLEPVGAGTVLELRSDLATTSRLLTVAGMALGPALQWAHHRVLDTGLEQFAAALPSGPD